MHRVLWFSEKEGPNPFGDLILTLQSYVKLRRSVFIICDKVLRRVIYKQKSLFLIKELSAF